MNPNVNGFNASTVFDNWRMDGQFFPRPPLTSTRSITLDNSFENYKFMDTPSGVSSSEKIR